MTAIPFNRPCLVGNELAYIAEAVTRGNVGGDGHFTERCQGFIEQRFGVPRCLMTPSCTAALELAAVLLDLRPGDEVILPSFTFVSTASAFARIGVRPAFVDIRPDTLNLDEGLVEAAITPRTRAIVAVHYAGVGCEMDRILKIGRRYGLPVVEDAAQAVGARYRGRHLGAIGQLGAYSFHETKNVVCGEGGALCVNDGRYAQRAEVLRDKGTNRKQFLRGEVDKYTWVDIGSSYVPSEIVCAFLLAQLEVFARINAGRRDRWEFYRQALSPLAREGALVLPHVPAECETNHHLFHVLLPSGQERDALLAALRERGIAAAFHYVPLHTSPVGRSYGYREGMLPVTESASRRLLRLPLYHDLTEADQVRVVGEIARILTRPTAAAPRRNAA